MSEMHAALNVSQRAADLLDKLHCQWRSDSLSIDNVLTEVQEVLHWEKHVGFLQQCLQMLPGQHAVADTSRYGRKVHRLFN